MAVEPGESKSSWFDEECYKVTDRRSAVYSQYRQQSTKIEKDQYDDSRQIANGMLRKKRRHHFDINVNYASDGNNKIKIVIQIYMDIYGRKIDVVFCQSPQLSDPIPADEWAIPQTKDTDAEVDILFL